MYRINDIVLVRAKDLERGIVQTAGIVGYGRDGLYNVWVLLPDRFMKNEKPSITNLYGPISWSVRESEIVCKLGHYECIQLLEEEDDDL